MCQIIRSFYAYDIAFTFYYTSVCYNAWSFILHTTGQLSLTALNGSRSFLKMECMKLRTCTSDRNPDDLAATVACSVMISWEADIDVRQCHASRRGAPWSSWLERRSWRDPLGPRPRFESRQRTAPRFFFFSSHFHVCMLPPFSVHFVMLHISACMMTHNLSYSTGQGN